MCGNDVYMLFSCAILRLIDVNICAKLSLIRDEVSPQTIYTLTYTRNMMK